jgi:hypothetical protein
MTTFQEPERKNQAPPFFGKRTEQVLDKEKEVRDTLRPKKNNKP